MIPLLFIAVGVALDLGWYYLNVSRLQNAADAATPLTDDMSKVYAYTMTDNWSPDSSEVTMTPYLGYNDEVFYYVVYLTEDIRHFLMPGRYEPIPALVVAVALLTKNATAAQYEEFMHKKSTAKVGRNIKKEARKFTTLQAKITEPSRYIFMTEVKAQAAQFIPLQKTSRL